MDIALVVVAGIVLVVVVVGIVLVVVVVETVVLMAVSAVEVDMAIQLVVLIPSPTILPPPSPPSHSLLPLLLRLGLS